LVKLRGQVYKRTVGPMAMTFLSPSDIHTLLIAAPWMALALALGIILAIKYR